MDNLLPFFAAARAAAPVLAATPATTLDAVLHDLAAAVEAEASALLAENALDLARRPAADPHLAHLQLTPARLSQLAATLRAVAALPSPLGAVLAHQQLPNGLDVTKVRVPLGVVGILYEARPHLTLDCLALCLKSGNVCLLKGSPDAANSNAALLSRVVQPVLSRHGLPAACATLLPPDRTATAALLTAVGYVDVLIPRGSASLLHHVRDHARVPVIDTGGGVVHLYVDASADQELGRAIIHNAKTRRPLACHALDCVLLHESQLPHLPALLAPLAADGVDLFADEAACAALARHYPAAQLHPATPAHFDTEFLGPQLALKTVPNLPAALAHIARHGGRHSEAILSQDAACIERFLTAVDAAVVYANASPAFTDGAALGLGAELGISTQKLHARGPLALDALCSYKWQVRGAGHTRE